MIEERGDGTFFESKKVPKKPVVAFVGGYVFGHIDSSFFAFPADHRFTGETLGHTGHAQSGNVDQFPFQRHFDNEIAQIDPAEVLLSDAGDHNGRMGRFGGIQHAILKFEFQSTVAEIAEIETVARFGIKITVFEKDIAFDGGTVETQSAVFVADDAAIFDQSRDGRGRGIEIAQHEHKAHGGIPCENAVADDDVGEFFIRPVGFKVNPGLGRSTDSGDTGAVFDQQSVNTADADGQTVVIDADDIFDRDIGIDVSFVGTVDGNSVAAGTVDGQIAHGDIVGSIDGNGMAPL